jgi:hypothetical protein
MVGLTAISERLGEEGTFSLMHLLSELMAAPICDLVCSSLKKPCLLPPFSLHCMLAP